MAPAVVILRSSSCDTSRVLKQPYSASYTIFILVSDGIEKCAEQ